MAGSIPLKVETLPLLDRRRRVLSDLRISVIDRCNFRCHYCMPEGNYPLDHAFLEKAERMRFEEIERLATKQPNKMLINSKPSTPKKLPVIDALPPAKPSLPLSASCPSSD